MLSGSRRCEEGALGLCFDINMIFVILEQIRSSSAGFPTLTQSKTPV